MIKKQVAKYYKLWAYQSKHKTLYDCYGKPSQEKRIAYHKIYDECISKGGKMLTVLTYNIHYFTCGYIYTEKGIPIFVLHTPSSRYEYDVLDLVQYIEVNKI